MWNLEQFEETLKKKTSEEKSRKYYIGNGYKPRCPSLLNMLTFYLISGKVQESWMRLFYLNIFCLDNSQCMANIHENKIYQQKRWVTIHSKYCFYIIFLFNCFLFCFFSRSFFCFSLFICSFYPLILRHILLCHKNKLISILHLKLNI